MKIAKGLDEVRQRLEALENKRNKDLSEDDQQASDTEVRICSGDSHCSDSEGESSVGSFASLTSNNSDGKGPYLVAKKRTHSNSGPLRINPSRKRKDRGELCSALGNTDEILLSATSSSMPSVSSRTRGAVQKSIQMMQEDLSTTTSTNNVYFGPGSKFSCNTFSSTVETVSGNTSLFANRSSRIRARQSQYYIPTQGDDIIMNMVQSALKHNVHINWPLADSILKQRHGYSKRRYTTVLQRCLKHDLTIKLTVLSAQANNQAVPWAALDDTYSAGYSKARWTQVLCAQCDKQGITRKGKLRMELFSQFMHASTYIECAQPSRPARGHSASRTVDGSVATSFNARSLPPARHAAATTSNSSNLRSNTTSHSITESGFTTEQDEHILSAVAFAARNSLQLRNVWFGLSTFMNKTPVSVEERWGQLEAKKRATRKNEVSNFTSRQTRGSNPDTTVNLSNTPMSSHSSNVACSHTRSDSSRNLTDAAASTGTISAVTSKNSARETTSCVNIDRYTHTEDQQILEFVAKREQDGVCMQETWNLLSRTLGRRVESLQARWFQLTVHARCSIPGEEATLTGGVTLVADMDPADNKNVEIGSKDMHSCYCPSHATSSVPNNTVTDNAELDSLTSTLDTGENIFVSTSTPIMQVFMSIFGTTTSKGTANSMEFTATNCSPDAYDNCSVQSTSHIPSTADSIHLAQSPLQGDSNLSTCVGIASINSLFFPSEIFDDNDNSNYW